MKYYKKDGHHFIENGPAKIRAIEAFKMPSPIMKKQGRVVRVFHVQEILRMNPENKLPVGAYLALSFPPEKANADAYEWCMNGKWEEMMVPYRMDHRPKVVTREVKRN